MKKEIILLVLIVAGHLIFSKTTLAKEILLATISSDYTSKTYGLSVNVNAKNKIESIVSKNNKKNSSKIYMPSVLDKEITLVKTVGIPLVTLLCKNFDAEAGCPIKINYPKNIAIANFDDFHARLRKVDGIWGLYSNNRKFTKMNLVAKKIMGALVGVKKIETN